MTSDHDSPRGSDGTSAGLLDDLIGALYRDVAEWNSGLTVLHPYGCVVVKRSVMRVVDSHVHRLREALLDEAPTSTAHAQEIAPCPERP